MNKLKMLGVSKVSLLIPVAKKDPLYYTFNHVNAVRYNVRPTFHHVLEFARLLENFDLERIPAISKNVQVYARTEKNATLRRGPPLAECWFNHRDWCAPCLLEHCTLDRASGVAVGVPVGLAVGEPVGGLIGDSVGVEVEESV
jgi:hypothetical protein